jgi:hypothetical protein
MCILISAVNTLEFSILYWYIFLYLLIKYGMFIRCPQFFRRFCLSASSGVLHPLPPPSDAGRFNKRKTIFCTLADRVQTPERGKEAPPCFSPHPPALPPTPSSPQRHLSPRPAVSAPCSPQPPESCDRCHARWRPGSPRSAPGARRGMILLRPRRWPMTGACTRCELLRLPKAETTAAALHDQHGGVSSHPAVILGRSFSLCTALERRKILSLWGCYSAADVRQYAGLIGCLYEALHAIPVNLNQPSGKFRPKEDHLAAQTQPAPSHVWSENPSTVSSARCGTASGWSICCCGGAAPAAACYAVPRWPGWGL